MYLHAPYQQLVVIRTTETDAAALLSLFRMSAASAASTWYIRLATFRSLRERLRIRLVLRKALVLPLNEQASNDLAQMRGDDD